MSTTSAQLPPPNFPATPSIPSASLNRLALYLRAVQELENQGVAATSSQQLAELAGVQPYHVRKDLAYCGRFGRRGQGYAVRALRRELTRSLGLDRRWQYIIVGLDLLGQALLTQDWGTQFVCVGLFDMQPERQGLRLAAPALPPTFPYNAANGRQLPPVPRQLRVRPLSELGSFLQEQAADMALLTLGGDQGQAAATELHQAGLAGILNFGTLLSSHREPGTNATHLQGSGDEANDTIVEQVDFQVSLQRLAFALLSKPNP